MVTMYLLFYCSTIFGEEMMREQLIEKMSGLIISAFGLVAALAWNDAIKGIFAHYYKKGDELSAQITYAIIVTLVAVIVTVWIGRIAGKIKDLVHDENLEKIAEKTKELIHKEKLSN